MYSTCNNILIGLSVSCACWYQQYSLWLIPGNAKMTTGHEEVLFYLICLQEAKQGLESAQNEAATSTSEEGKAEAMIAVECYEAIIKALESH